VPPPLPDRDAGSPFPRPDPLESLRGWERLLAALIRDVELRPDNLDAQAGAIHDEIVIEAYRLLCAEIGRCGRPWDSRAQNRFRKSFSDTANSWPAYREALAELDLARARGVSVVRPMMEVKPARVDYIAALSDFQRQFSGTLGFFFPGS
jgi:hypothetical protein